MRGVWTAGHKTSTTVAWPLYRLASTWLQLPPIITCLLHGFNYHQLSPAFYMASYAISSKLQFNLHCDIGAGTGPAGLAMAGPFSGKVET